MTKVHILPYVKSYHIHCSVLQQVDLWQLFVTQLVGQSFTERKGNRSSSSPPGEKLLCQDEGSLAAKPGARNTPVFPSPL